MKFLMIVQQTSVQIGDNVKITFLLISTLLTSCSWLESDYDKLMNPIKDIKLAEKKAGKPNPTYDGVVEPDFPDEKLNNETLEGVDSNKDGVRDDVEIWINRVAEDEYVRSQQKEYYKSSFDFHITLINSDANYGEKERKVRESKTCLMTLLTPYESKYFNMGIDRYRFYSKSFMSIIYNTSERLKLVHYADKFNFQNLEDIKTNDNSFCSKKIPESYLIKIIKDNQIK